MTAQEFPLAWRWTDSQYAVLSTAALSSIQPVGVHDAQTAFEQAQVFRPDGRLSASLFTSIARHSADVTDQDGSAWLRARHERLADIVTIVWSAECAVRTTWETFTEHWSDFCYPMEDVIIWPSSERWVLLYQHYEEFEFGHRP